MSSTYIKSQKLQKLLTMFQLRKSMFHMTKIMFQSLLYVNKHVSYLLYHIHFNSIIFISYFLYYMQTKLYMECFPSFFFITFQYYNYLLFNYCFLTFLDVVSNKKFQFYSFYNKVIKLAIFWF